MQNLTPLFSDLVQRGYAFYDQLGLSVTGLLLAGAICLILLVFGLRELVTWFFKIDDIKRDLRRIRESLNEVEGELRTLQALRIQTEEKAAESIEDLPLENPELKEQAAKPAPTKGPSFPLIH
jgi:uncharacterized protein (DUF3084 family)